MTKTMVYHCPYGKVLFSKYGKYHYETYMSNL
jgi:hypothetical protein